MKAWKGLTLAVVAGGIAKGLFSLVVFAGAQAAGKAAVQAVHSAPPSASSYAQNLSALAAQINKQGKLPATRFTDGENIRQEAVWADDQDPHRLNYTYTWMDYTSAQADEAGFDAATFVQETLPIARSRVCGDDFTRKLLQEGVTLHYTYRANDEKVMVAYAVTGADCSAQS